MLSALLTSPPNQIAFDVAKLFAYTLLVLLIPPFAAIAPVNVELPT